MAVAILWRACLLVCMAAVAGSDFYYWLVYMAAVDGNENCYQLSVALARAVAIPRTCLRDSIYRHRY